MTCIVGVVDKGNVYFGGDSCGTNYYTYSINKNPKVIIKNDYLFGFTGSIRMAQILQYSFTPPMRHPSTDLGAYLIASWVPELRSVFKSSGFGKSTDGEDSGGCFLIGHAGRLFEVQDDFSLVENTTGYAAVGTGGMVALGALHALAGGEIEPEERVRRALKASEDHVPSVRAPFTILKI